MAAAFDRCFWLDGAATHRWSGHRSILGWLTDEDISLSYSTFGGVAPDGRADLAVVIRSLTTTGDAPGSLGTGGGITVQSDVAEEYAEATWKAERLLCALESVLSPGAA